MAEAVIEGVIFMVEALVELACLCTSSGRSNKSERRKHRQEKRTARKQRRQERKGS